MSVSERTAYKNAILRAAARSSDPYFHAVLYEALIDIQQERLHSYKEGPGLHSWDMVTVFVHALPCA
eukprot:364639-Chlamydomonas_euryale.AAC.37